MQSMLARRLRSSHSRSLRFSGCNIHNPLIEGHRFYMRPGSSKQRRNRISHGPLVEKPCTRFSGDYPEFYCTERLRDEPGIKVKTLVRELKRFYGYRTNEKNLGSYISATIYRKHPEIRRARIKALKKAGWNQPTNRRAELREKILELKAKGKFKGIEPLLNKTEKALVNNALSKNPKTYKMLAKEVGRTQDSLFTSQLRLFKKIRRWESGGDFRIKRGQPGQPWEGRLVKRIKKIIADRTAQGETLGQIKKNAKLNKTECTLLDIYVLPQQRITLEKAAELVGRKKIGTACALRSLENKLLGRPRDYHLTKKYMDMSDEELTAEVERLKEGGKEDKTTRIRLIARERGIWQKVFPSQHVKELRDALNVALAQRTLEEILSNLTDIEKDIMNRIALAKFPISRKELAKQHNIKVYVLATIEKNLLKKLKGEEKIDDLAKLRTQVKEIGPEKIAELRAQMSEREIAILERRVNKERPDTLKEVGVSFLISRERARHAQLCLYYKLENFKATGRFELPEHVKRFYYE